MDKKEEIIGGIIISMQQYLEVEQLQKLDNVLSMQLHGITFQEECTELSTEVDDNLFMMNLFEANKKLEGCKEGTVNQYLREVRKFLFTCNKNYKNVTKEDLKAYLGKYSMHVKPNTVVNAKKYLSSFFSWLHDEGYIAKNPMRGVKGIKAVEVPNKHLSLEEEVAVRDVPKTLRDQAIIDFMLSTGLRVGEIEALRRNNVDFIHGSCTFIGEKNGKERTVYLDVRAKKHLIEYLMSRDDNCDALFVSKKKYRNEFGVYEKKDISKAALEKIAKDTATKAGITDKICTVHVYRKTFATRLAENGCALEIIQTLLGHSSANVTSKHYVAKTERRVRTEFQRCMAA